MASLKKHTSTVFPQMYLNWEVVGFEDLYLYSMNSQFCVPKELKFGECICSLLFTEHLFFF